MLVLRSRFFSCSCVSALSPKPPKPSQGARGFAGDAGFGGGELCTADAGVDAGADAAADAGADAGGLALASWAGLRTGLGPVLQDLGFRLGRFPKLGCLITVPPIRILLFGGLV